MAQDFIGKAAAKLGLDVNDFVSGAKRAAKQFDAISAAGNKLRSVAKGAAASLAGMFTVDFLKGQLNAAAELDAFSTRLGVGVEALQAYSVVAQDVNVSQQTLTLGWQRMTRRIAEASQGLGEAQGALKELGLSAEALNKLSPDKQFEEIAAALNKIPNQADKVRLAFKLFDSEGVSLLQVIDEMKNSTGDLTQEMKNLGFVISKETIESMARLNKSLDRGSKRLSVIIAQELGEVSEAFELMQLTRAGTTQAFIRAQMRAQEIFGTITKEDIKNYQKRSAAASAFVKSLSAELSQLEPLQDPLKDALPDEKEIEKFRKIQEKMFNDQRKLADMRLTLAEREIQDRLDRKKKILDTEQSLADAMADIYERQARDAEASAQRLKDINEQRANAMQRVQDILRDMDRRKLSPEELRKELFKDIQTDLGQARQTEDLEKRRNEIAKIIEETNRWGQATQFGSDEFKKAQDLIREANRDLINTFNQLQKEAQEKAADDKESAQATLGVVSELKAGAMKVQKEFDALQKKMEDLKAHVKLVGQERLRADVQRLVNEIEATSQIEIPIKVKNAGGFESNGFSDFNEDPFFDLDEEARQKDRKGE